MSNPTFEPGLPAPRSSSPVKWILIGIAIAVVLLILPCIGILVAIAVPGFLRAREVARLNACQQNQTMIDTAVHQYALENNLSGVREAATAANLGTLCQNTPGDGSWSGSLVGPNLYLLEAPRCPSGGVYCITPTGPTPVTCSHAKTPGVDPRFAHIYPASWVQPQFIMPESAGLDDIE